MQTVVSSITAMCNRLFARSSSNLLKYTDLPVSPRFGVIQRRASLKATHEIC